MKKYIVPTIAAAAVVTMPAFAQETSAEEALMNSFKAEHSVWKEDVARWDSEHDEAVRLLSEAIEKFSEESALDRHSESIAGHSSSLKDSDLAGMADHHARVRSQHEEMREAHHHLMDAVSMVAKALEEDENVMADKDETPEQED